MFQYQFSPCQGGARLTAAADNSEFQRSSTPIDQSTIHEHHQQQPSDKTSYYDLTSATAIAEAAAEGRLTFTAPPPRDAVYAAQQSSHVFHYQHAPPPTLAPSTLGNASHDLRRNLVPDHSSMMISPATSSHRPTNDPQAIPELRNLQRECSLLKLEKEELKSEIDQMLRDFEELRRENEALKGSLLNKERVQEKMGQQLDYVKATAYELYEKFKAFKLRYHREQVQQQQQLQQQLTCNGTGTNTWSQCTATAPAAGAAAGK